MLIYLDNFVKDVNGGSRNAPIPFDTGVIYEIVDYIPDETVAGHGFTYISCENGVVKRSINYWEGSPYGWNKVSSNVPALLLSVRIRPNSVVIRRLDRIRLGSSRLFRMRPVVARWSKSNG